LTEDFWAFNFDRGSGVDWVRLLRSVLVIFLLGTAVCAFALPRADVPETAFNEADAPVNLAPPAQPGIRVAVAPPAVNPIAVLPMVPRHCATCLASSFVLESTSAPKHRDHHSLQDLLCTFLI
jgi:hypothetical protein